MRYKNRLLAKKGSVAEEWGWYGSHLDIKVNSIGETGAASFDVMTPEMESIRIHDMDVFVANLKKLYSKARAKNIELDINENMEIEGLEETKGFASKPPTDRTIGKVYFGSLPDTDDSWGWEAGDINLNITTPEPDKTNEGAITIKDPSNNTITFNGLSAFLILLNKANSLAKQKGLELMSASNYGISESDKQMFKDVGIKAKKAELSEEDYSKKYLAFVLDEASRTEILNNIKPKYKVIVCHHVTVTYDLNEENIHLYEDLKNASLEVVGYQYGLGVDCVAVEVNGNRKRPDGSIYHVTLSLKRGHRPEESNDILRNQGVQEFIPFPITGTLQFLDK